LRKKLRTGAAGKEVIATGSLLPPLLDDVSFSFLSYHTFCLLKKGQLLDVVLLRVVYFAARDEGDV
jgi:hypothetical protein